MPLLFWYLPFMIVSGAFDSLYEQDDARRLEAGKAQDRNSLVAASEGSSRSFRPA
jgi:hypothetical protein